MTDALGNPIVLGNLYGYSTSASGIITVTTGTALRITGEKSLKVTLNDPSATRFLYGEKTEPWDYGDAVKPRAVSVYTCHVFPIHEGPK